MSEKKADIGVIGLGVMGAGIAGNIAEKGFHIAVYNRSAERTKHFAEEHAGFDRFLFAYSIEDFILFLERPRKVLLMVKSGKAVDELIEVLTPLLEEGDIIIDGGNSNFEDTSRREAGAGSQGILYAGAGISGGEYGARYGPAIMLGGSEAAWPKLRDIFCTIAAKVDGKPCCEWVGKAGSGHFVKMIHNGIEYGDMQIICETYHIMRDYLRLNNTEMYNIFKKWNEGRLDSYLIEITRDIFAYKDDDGEALLDKILDAAGQKGTGKWAVLSSLDEGVPLTIVSESVFARVISCMKKTRSRASRLFDAPIPIFEGDVEKYIEKLEQALYAAKICSYAQGFTLMKSASENHGWNLNYGDIAMIWRGGCIIRSMFLSKIKEAFNEYENLENLLYASYFKNATAACLPAWRDVVKDAVSCGIPTPAMSSGLSYFDSLRCERLPSNLLQAQRDYFGAHTYERTDKPAGCFFHTEWVKKDETGLA